jgi:hypothetical protein
MKQEPEPVEQLHRGQSGDRNGGIGSPGVRHGFAGLFFPIGLAGGLRRHKQGWRKAGWMRSAPGLDAGTWMRA